MRLSLALVAATLLTACAPRTTISFEMPAEITVPTVVQSLTVVDRKGSTASAAARLALQEELAAGTRFRVAEAAAAQAALGTVKGTVGVPFDASAASAVGKAAGADGLVAVDEVKIVDDWSYTDRLESRTRTEYRRPVDCADCEPVATEVTEEFTVVDATLTVGVTVGYQLYGVDGALVEAWTESLSSTSTGTAEGVGHEAEARAAAAEPADLAIELAEATAFEAARHIAPWLTSADRRWYASGGPEVVAGARLARHDDWAGAERAWRKGKATAEDDVKGRLLFNLAVAAERRGDIAAALDLVKAAKGKLRDPKHAEAYQDELRLRKRQARALATQMAPPPAEE